MPPRRPKVGSSRMDAALDAMRPMGFSAPVVRKCVRNLLKVYGEDGWVAIEEAAYTLLIDTLLEEPVVGLLEQGPQNPLLEGGSQSQETDHEEKPEPLKQLKLGNDVIDEAAYTLLIGTLLEEPVVGQLEHGPQKNPVLEGGSQSQATDHGEQPKSVQQLKLSDEKEIVEDKKVIAKKTCGDGVIKIKREECEEQGPVTTGSPMLWQAQLGLPLARTPECADINSKKRAGKPCFGWISDDEDDEFVQLMPAKRVGIEP